jgi:hypothetical protein
LRLRVWASANADGSSARELTSGAQQTSTVTTNNSAEQTSTLTWSAPAITLSNEYLFFQIECYIVSSGASNAVLMHRLSTSIVTTDFGLGAVSSTKATLAAQSAHTAGTGSVATAPVASGAMAAQAAHTAGAVVGRSDRTGGTLAAQSASAHGVGVVGIQSTKGTVTAQSAHTAGTVVGSSSNVAKAPADPTIVSGPVFNNFSGNPTGGFWTPATASPGLDGQAGDVVVFISAFSAIATSAVIAGISDDSGGALGSWTASFKSQNFTDTQSNKNSWGVWSAIATKAFTNLHCATTYTWNGFTSGGVYGVAFVLRNVSNVSAFDTNANAAKISTGTGATHNLTYSTDQAHDLLVSAFLGIDNGGGHGGYNATAADSGWTIQKASAANAINYIVAQTKSVTSTASGVTQNVYANSTIANWGALLVAFQSDYVAGQTRLVAGSAHTAGGTSSSIQSTSAALVAGSATTSGTVVGSSSTLAADPVLIGTAIGSINSSSASNLTTSTGLSGNAGDVLVALVTLFTNNPAGTVTGVTGGGFTWTKKGGQNWVDPVTSNPTVMEVWSAVATSSYSNVAPVAALSRLTPIQYDYIIALNLRSVSNAAPFDVNAGSFQLAHGTSSTHSITFSTTAAHCFLISLFLGIDQVDSGYNPAANDAGWTIRQASTATTWTYVVAQTKSVTSAQSSAVQNIYANSTLANWGTAFLALQGSAAAPTAQAAHTAGTVVVSSVTTKGVCNAQAAQTHGLAMPAVKAAIAAQAAHTASVAVSSSSSTKGVLAAGSAHTAGGTVTVVGPTKATLAAGSATAHGTAISGSGSTKGVLTAQAAHVSCAVAARSDATKAILVAGSAQAHGTGTIGIQSTKATLAAGSAVTHGTIVGSSSSTKGVLVAGIATAHGTGSVRVMATSAHLATGSAQAHGTGTTSSSSTAAALQAGSAVTHGTAIASVSSTKGILVAQAAHAAGAASVRSDVTKGTIAAGAAHTAGAGIDGSSSTKGVLTTGSAATGGGNANTIFAFGTPDAQPAQVQGAAIGSSKTTKGVLVAQAAHTSGTAAVRSDTTKGALAAQAAHTAGQAIGSGQETGALAAQAAHTSGQGVVITSCSAALFSDRATVHGTAITGSGATGALHAQSASTSGFGAVTTPGTNTGILRAQSAHISAAVISGSGAIGTPHAGAAQVTGLAIGRSLVTGTPHAGSATTAGSATAFFPAAGAVGHLVAGSATVSGSADISTGVVHSTSAHLVAQSARISAQVVSIINAAGALTAGQARVKGYSKPPRTSTLSHVYFYVDHGVVMSTRSDFLVTWPVTSSRFTVKLIEKIPYDTKLSTRVLEDA